MLFGRVGGRTNKPGKGWASSGGGTTTGESLQAAPSTKKLRNPEARLATGAGEGRQVGRYLDSQPRKRYNLSKKKKGEESIPRGLRSRARIGVSGKRTTGSPLSNAFEGVTAMRKGAKSRSRRVTGRLLKN